MGPVSGLPYRSHRLVRGRVEAPGGAATQVFLEKENPRHIGMEIFHRWYVDDMATNRVQYMELTITDNIEIAKEKLKSLEGITDLKIDGETILVEFSEKIDGKEIIRFCVKERVL